MTDSEQTKRPVRKLTVKNFSVIKEAELEFGKITILIGPQASGKSLLCKLAFFLRNELIGTAVDALDSGLDWGRFETLVAIRFSEWFPPESWATSGFSIRLTLDRYDVELRGPTRGKGNQLLSLAATDEFKARYANLSQMQPSRSPNLNPEERQMALWNAFGSLQSQNSLASPIYIPSGRAFFTNNLGAAVLQNANLDPLIRRFNAEIIWNSAKWKPGLLTTNRGVTDSISQTLDKIVGGSVITRGSEPAFEADDGRILPFSVLSSGTQELLPLFVVVNRMAHLYEHFYARTEAVRREIDIKSSPVVFLEEPEAHVFPKTQQEMVRLFAWLGNDPVLSFDWVITTHSPYLLTAFNELLSAGMAAKARPDRVDEIKKIVPQECWINEGDLVAYAFNGQDGTLHRMMDEETGLINGDVLDSVSDRMGGDFDRLLEIEYGN